MNNEIFSRIIKLFSTLGIDVSKGTDGRGEAAALSAGFGLISGLLDDMLNNIFVQTADGEGLKMLLSLINECHTDDIESDRQLILNRLSKGWGYLDYDEFVDVLSTVGPFAECDINGTYIYLTGVAYPASVDSMLDAGRFIKEYMPAVCTPSLAGDGIRYEYFDWLDMPWFQLDEVNLPFNLLDEMEGM